MLATGRVFDVLDVPVAAGMAALEEMERSAVRPGPVAVSVGDRALFFVLSRVAYADQDEIWACHLDCEPETVDQIAGLRWHCRDSYVLAPPSRLRGGLTARWIREPGPEPLPDGLRLLEFLADACEAIS
jgi:Bifunctional DNA primase/polymerase, N-terminal